MIFYPYSNMMILCFSGISKNTCNFPVMLKIGRRKADSDGFFQKIYELKDLNVVTDFVLKADGSDFAWHKLVLAARSAYFLRLVTHSNSKEIEQGFVEFETFHNTALEAVLEYCYTGIIEFKAEEALHIIEVADYLQIPDLVSKISKQIADHVTTDNCVSWHFVAKCFGMNRLEETTKEIMSVDFSNVTNNTEFLALDYNNVIDYITWEDIDKDLAVVGVCRWIKHDLEHRQCMLHDIVNAIDINGCSFGALNHVIQQYEDVLTSDVKQKFIDTVLGKLPSWQEPDRGAGYDIVILG